MLESLTLLKLCKQIAWLSKDDDVTDLILNSFELKKALKKFLIKVEMIKREMIELDEEENEKWNERAEIFRFNLILPWDIYSYENLLTIYVYRWRCCKTCAVVLQENIDWFRVFRTERLKFNLHWAS